MGKEIKKPPLDPPPNIEITKNDPKKSEHIPPETSPAEK